MSIALSSSSPQALQHMLFPLEPCFQSLKPGLKGKGQSAPRSGKRPAAQQLVLQGAGFPFGHQQTKSAAAAHEALPVEHATVGAVVMTGRPEASHSHATPTLQHHPAEIVANPVAVRLPPEELRSRVTTLGDAIRVLDQLDDVTASTKIDWRSAASSFARKQKVDMDQIRLDPIEMRDRIKDTQVMTGKRCGQKRQANIRSALNMLAMRMGWVIAYGGPKAIPVAEPEWIALLGQLPHTPQKSNLAGFARFCEARGWKPEDLTPCALEDYGTWREANTYDTCVRTTILAVRKTWNRAVEQQPGWPRMRFETRRNPRHFRAPLEEFAPELLAELDAFRHDIQYPDPFEDNARKAVSSTTANMYVDGLRWGITALARATGSLADIRSLCQVVTPANFQVILRARYSSSGEKWCAMARSITAAFLDLARRRLALPTAEREAIESLAKRVKSTQGRLSERRTDDTLAIITDPEILVAFMKMPWKIARAAEDLLAAGRPVRAAELHEMAVVTGLLLQSPLRRRAICRLDVSLHFARNSRGRVCAFKVPHELSKTGVRIDHQIDGPTVQLLERHLKVFRPVLVLDEKDTALFPSRVAGKKRSFVGFAARLKRVAEKEIGSRFYIHLVRHVVAAMLLSDNPQNGPIAQRMLGHRALTTTEGTYGHVATSAVHQNFADGIERQLKRAETRLKGRSK